MFGHMGHQLYYLFLYLDFSYNAITGVNNISCNSRDEVLGRYH